MTQIIDHGKWVPYKPDQLPPTAPPAALFCRRESDGVDWYDYVNAGTNFSAEGVKFTAFWQDAYNGFTVGAATRDPTRLFPAGMLVREIIDYHGGDPQIELGERLYHPDTNTLHDRPPPPQLNFDFQELEARVAAIEAKLGMRP
jgi:hypothetical protein